MLAYMKKEPGSSDIMDDYSTSDLLSSIDEVYIIKNLLPDDYDTPGQALGRDHEEIPCRTNSLTQPIIGLAGQSRF